ncbi:MAG: class IV adenylate cyclase [Patescibacteria group bacterium]
MAREIEVKARVKDFDQVIAKLRDLGCEITEPIIQDDKIFVHKDYGDYVKLHIGSNVLRIRTVNNEKSFFTLKQSVKNELDCIEKQTEVAKPQEMHDALIMMGYENVVSVYKKRQKIKYQDYTICLDQVRDLGNFIEVERLFEDDKEASGIQEEIFEFLETLGVEEQDRVTHGYDTLMYLKLNNKINN